MFLGQWKISAFFFFESCSCGYLWANLHAKRLIPIPSPVKDRPSMPTRGFARIFLAAWTLKFAYDGSQTQIVCVTHTIQGTTLPLGQSLGLRQDQLSKQIYTQQTSFYNVIKMA